MQVDKQVDRSEGRLRPTGAALMYVDNSVCKRAVEDLIEKAQLIVTRAGTSAGFMWELEAVIRVVGPEPLIILLPSDEDGYNSFRAAASERLPVALPSLEGSRHRLLSFAGHLRFGEGWKPGFEVLQAESGLRGKRLMNSSAALPSPHMSLRPVYEQFGVSWF